MLKKVGMVVLALAFSMAFGATAFAQDVDAAEGTTKPGSIEISNPAKGVEYKVYKVFDATYNTANVSIAYTVMADKVNDTLPTGFTKDANGYVSGPRGTELDEDTINSIAAYIEGDSEVTSATSDGSSPLTFKNLDYGYYYVTSGQGSAVAINSTNPKASITDKNTTAPIGNLSKTVDNANINIGDTVTYTVSFTTANYEGSAQITEYTITDTLPEFLSNVSVTKIMIGNTEYKVNEEVPQFDESTKTITIPWTNEDDESIYPNSAKVEITYTAKVTDKAAIAGQGNTNTVTVNYKKGDTEGTKLLRETATIKTYAIAIKKIDDKGAALSGATFSISDIQTEAVDGKSGEYVVTGTTAEGGTDTVMSTDDNGILIVKGLKSGTAVSVNEVVAPVGYNKLASAVQVTPVASTETTTNVTKYIDENGGVTETETSTTVNYINNDLAATVAFVVNKTGTPLPSTGGMGTTLFYVVGGLLVVGAAVTMVVRKRMTGYED